MKIEIKIEKYRIFVAGKGWIKKNHGYGGYRFVKDPAKATTWTKLQYITSSFNEGALRRLHDPYEIIKFTGTEISETK